MCEDSVFRAYFLCVDENPNIVCEKSPTMQTEQNMILFYYKGEKEK